MPVSFKKRRSKGKGRVEERERPQYTYYDMLTLRPAPSGPAASLPRPRRAALPGGLPLWNKRPLDHKLPLMQGPDGPFVFTRGKLGEKLWKGSSVNEFQLSDPYGREVRFEYEPAHDSHLHAWLHKQDTLSMLKTQGLVTPQCRVSCSVQQYNNYRQFLRNLYRDALRHEADRRENLKMEKLMVNKANENAEKEAVKLKRIEDSRGKRLSNSNKLEAQQLERLENCRRRLQRVIDQAARAEARKDTEVEQRKQRMEAFDERIRSRVVAAECIERMNKIKAMKAWHKQDKLKKKEFERRKLQRELENKQKAEMRWKRKVEEQKKQIAKEEYLYEQKRKAMEMFRQQYMKAMQKEWTRFEDELNIRKCQGTIEKVKHGMREKSIKQIMKSVSEAYSLRKSLAYLSQDESTIDTLMERIQITLKEIRYDLEPYIVIAHAKGRLEKQENVPLPVSGAIKYLLEQTVVEYTAKQLSLTVANTAKRMLTAIDEIKMQPTLFERQSISMKKSSLLGPTTKQPSISTLTEVLFKEYEGEEFEDEDFGEFSFIEQKKLDRTIDDVSNRISRMVPTRVRTVVESRSYDRISVLSIESVSDEFPENKPVAKLCSLILFNEAVHDHELTLVVDRMILSFMQDIHLTPSYLRFKMKQKLEGSPSVTIIPCYDGHTLAGVQKVVKDGLSVISIKQSHRSCQFLTDPITKVPRLSCAQGIKARNSFWNLHKPDLRKVKGLECATSESVTQMLKAHSVENVGKPTYKRKILRLLGSLVTKRTISPTQMCVLQSDTSWPVNTCVLSSICRETEIKQNGMVGGTQTLSKSKFLAKTEYLNRDKSANALIFENNNVIIIENEDCSLKSDFDISIPSSSGKTPYNFDFTYENVDGRFVSSNGSDRTKVSSYIYGKDLEEDNASYLIQQNPIKISHSNLKTNSSQIKISISSEVMIIPQIDISCIQQADNIDNKVSIINASVPPICENNNARRKGNSSLIGEDENYEETQSASVDMIKSVFSEMLKDMKDIEDYISAYISSFCILEEEFDNYAAIKSSSEVVSHFLNEMQSSGKDVSKEIRDSKPDIKNEQDKYFIYRNDLKSNFDLEAKSRENCLNEGLTQKESSYCYWEDETSGLTSFEMYPITSINHLDKGIIQESAHNKNTALVPLRFFENIWKNIFEPQSNEDSLQYECFNGASLPQYWPTASMYDPTILQEAENIVFAVDNFLDGCFHIELSNTGRNIPCKIIELDDDYNELLNTGEEISCTLRDLGTESNQKLANDEAEWNDTTRILQSSKIICSVVNKDNITDRENFLNTPNTEIATGYNRNASSLKSNTELTAPIDKIPREQNSGCERHFKSNNIPSFVEETSLTQNQKLTNNEISNEKSDHIKIEQPSMKKPQTYEQNQNIAFSTVGSPLNMHKISMCSSEYRGNTNDISVKTLEGSITSDPSVKNSNRSRSRFVHVEDSNNNNSNYLFSSPNVQLNLTNPLSNEKN